MVPTIGHNMKNGSVESPLALGAGLGARCPWGPRISAPTGSDLRNAPDAHRAIEGLEYDLKRSNVASLYRGLYLIPSGKGVIEHRGIVLSCRHPVDDFLRVHVDCFPGVVVHYQDFCNHLFHLIGNSNNKYINLSIGECYNE